MQPSKFIGPGFTTKGVLGLLKAKPIKKVFKFVKY